MNQQSLNLEHEILLAREGDIDAFGRLVREFEWVVRGYVISRCPPGADVDDVAQVTFIEAFKNLARFEPGTNFRAWLLTIARYQVMGECSRLRRLAESRQHYIPRLLELEIERRAAGEPEEDDRIEAVRDCVEQLNQSSRELVHLRYHGDMKLKDIAKQLDRSVGAVKKHFFMIRQKLHECLEGKSGRAGGGAA